ncbi:AAA family ATPase [Acinetobacter lactucae]|uniref:AAA family ATPase n=1 Tax=Acinetobacter lactucae TaxID=1785128 RepID=UPI00237C1F4C|nr:DUF3696 domain-containing protein [Acinetobacter lactucae]MDD9316649.1 DUF3696 domain-containing protein [Acinetobacter lactucae]
MLSYIHLKNFKSYIDQNIPLNNLTILSGLNNSGKSSVIQAFRMLNRSTLGKTPYISDHGSYEELLCKFVQKDKPIIIEIDGNSKLEIHKNKCIPAANCPLLTYIGADRLGPQKNLPIQYQPSMYNYLGENGEFILDIISALEFSRIPNELHHEKSPVQTFMFELKSWLTEISPDIDFQIEIDTKSDLGKAKFDNYRPNNVGFGLSYTLPILVAGLALSSQNHKGDNIDELESLVNWYEKKESLGAILIVENPEAHLHPRGQTRLGLFLAKVANCGVQVIVETHSDHVIDGIRIAVKDKFLNKDKVIFHYLEKHENLTKLQTINIDEQGKMSYWPNGFFDEALKNRAYLMRTK